MNCYWEPFTLNHYAANFGAYRSCASEDNMFLICRVTLCDCVIKVHIPLWVGHLLMLMHHCVIFGVYRYYRDAKFRSYNVILQGYIVQEVCPMILHIKSNFLNS